ncbi:MAG: hypothetical protein JWN68_740 [Nocardioides sp.]|uniref:hypothetical protein n=1 Tax=Nocardioides sp. TaxID=35761 RepID=UPI002639CE45|nr:hypothetical protein [Nocardioides sp.]MCW2832787.1 hypothetical protein [Nocardioides sp.]
MTDFDTDFEIRLRATLHQGAAQARSAPGLATGARRLRQRRRRATGAALAVVAVLIGGPTALALTDGDTPRSSPDVATERVEGTAGAPRTVSFRDVTAEVPMQWSDGCPYGTEEYAVWIGEVPENPGFSCDGRSTYGIEFFRTEVNRQYGGDATAEVRLSTSGYRPEGAWTGGVISTLGTAVVTMPTRGGAQRIVDSLEVLEGATPDGNGCPAKKDDAEVRLDNGITETTICRYDGEGLLEQSDLLTAEESQTLWDTITAAPRAEASSASCASPLWRETVLLTDGAYVGTVTTGAGCDERVRLSGVEREVTADVRLLVGILW